MADDRNPSFLKNICPLCGGTSVIRNDKVLGLRAPKFNCPDCGAGLTTTPTPRILFAFAVVFIALPAALALISLLKVKFELQGLLLTCIYGGVVGGLSSYAFQLVFNGLVFKKWRMGGF